METVNPYIFPGLKNSGFKHGVNMDKIMKVVSSFYSIHPSVITAKTRRREIVQARQICMYLSVKYTKNSLADIGYNFGGYDHATVLHAKKTINNLLETDRKFSFQFEQIEELLLYGKLQQNDFCIDNYEKNLTLITYQEKKTSLYTQILKERIEEKRIKSLMQQLAANE